MYPNRSLNEYFLNNLILCTRDNRQDMYGWYGSQNNKYKIINRHYCIIPNITFTLYFCKTTLKDYYFLYNTFQ